MNRLVLTTVSLVLSIFSLGFACFNLGYKVGIDRVKEATEKVEIVEEVEDNFYSEDVPLTYEEQEDLYKASEEFGVDYYTMLGLIEKETDFRNISGDGGKATGYCQIWRVYWSDLMEDIGAEDLTVPKDNFRTACAIVSELNNRYGCLAGALTAYNAGYYDGTVSNYAMNVLEYAEKWRRA